MYMHFFKLSIESFCDSNVNEKIKKSLIALSGGLIDKGKFI